MTRQEIDVMWQKALHKAVMAGEQFTRYDFAEMVAAAEREACEQLCIDNGHMGLAAAIRARGQA